MRPQELKLGNIVSYLGKETIIESISGLEECYAATKLSGIMPINVFERILLTEDYLLRFGFSDKDYKKSYIGKDFKSGGMILDFVLSKPFSKGDWNNTYTFDLENNRFCKVEYIHDLQNLFYQLTGTELTLNNK